MSVVTVKTWRGTEFRGVIDFQELDFVIEWCGVGSGSLVCSFQDGQELMKPGSRAAIYVDDVRVVSVQPNGWKLSRDGDDQTVTIDLVDENVLFDYWLIWPSPGVLPSRTDTQVIKDYDRRSGPANQVAFDYLRANRGRLREDVVFGDRPGDGGRVSLEQRFHPVSEKILPTVRDAGGIMRLDRWETDGRLHLVFAVGGEFQKVLDWDSGAITSWDMGWKPPTGTHGVIAADGEGADRWYETFESDNWWLEFGVSREIFIDARDLKESEYTEEDNTTVRTYNEKWPSERDARVAEKLREAAEKSSMKIVLDDASKAFEFSFWDGQGLKLGDRVTLRVGDVTVTERVRRCQIVSDSSGVVLTPIVGDWVEDTEDTGQAPWIRRLGSQVSLLERR